MSLESVEDWPNDTDLFWLDEADLPGYVKDLVVLNSAGQTVEEASRTLVQRDADGTEKRIPILRIPAMDIGFSSQDALDDAVLAAMGYDPEDLPTPAA